MIILTTFDLDQLVYDALAAGASGFLLKDVTPEHLIAAARLVRTGDALLAPAITRRLVERHATPIREAESDGPTEPHPDLSALTPRELEVLRLLAQGLSNTELAARLHLSETTARYTSHASSPSSHCVTAFRRWSSPTRPDWSERQTDAAPDA